MSGACCVGYGVQGSLVGGAEDAFDICHVRKGIEAGVDRCASPQLLDLQRLVECGCARTAGSQ